MQSSSVRQDETGTVYITGPLIGSPQSFEALRKAGVQFDNERLEEGDQCRADSLRLPTDWRYAAFERKSRPWIDVFDKQGRTRAWLASRSMQVPAQGWSLQALIRFREYVEPQPDHTTLGKILDADREVFTVRATIDADSDSPGRFKRQLETVDQAFAQWYSARGYTDRSNPGAHWDEP